MNTSQLKSFAQQARLKLMEQVGAKLHYVLNVDSASIRGKEQELNKLKAELNEIGEQALIEKVAYTWFNRLVAIRFMDANGFQPFNVSIISPVEGSQSSLAEVIELIQGGNIPEELNLDRGLINDLLDGKAVSNNPNNEIMRMVLVEACNYYHSLFPFLFEKINDYTELLLPDDLVSPISILADVVKGMSKEDCTEVEIIGWLYQFYISEKKDELINAKKKYKKDEIAPVTQLFTPKWLVQFMVDNSLGQYLYELNGQSSLINDLEYYIKPNNPENLPKRDGKKLEEIKFFDPCVGSGHILCYAFDIFYRAYEAEGYNQADIPELIITNNLFGIDIDERASQLATLALIFKCRIKYRRFFKKIEKTSLKPNVFVFKNFQDDPYLNNATSLGSLIRIPRSAYNSLEVSENTIFSEQESQIKEIYNLLSNTYDIVVTNPPYLNSSYMEDDMKKYIETNYKETKSDLFAAFLIRVQEYVVEDGLIGFICPYVWMFIQSYEKLRKQIIDETTISTLVQLEYNAFGPAVVPICAFTLRNQYVDNYKGSYVKLSDFKGEENQAPKTLEAIENPNCGWFYIANQKDFEKVPGYNIGYWLSDKFSKIFDSKLIYSYSHSPSQNVTGNNNRYLRNNWEISEKNYKNKWISYAKGGGIRKWTGNLLEVINWSKEAVDNYINSHGSQVINKDFWFKKAITWGLISSNNPSFRIMPDGATFDKGGSSIIVEDKYFNYILGLLNSKIFLQIVRVFNPTLNFQVKDIRSMPLILNNLENMNGLVNNLVCVSQLDWDSHETSWDFQQNELVRLSSDNLSTAIESYKAYWKEQFFQLHHNEVELNRQFIEIYGLQDELTPDVPLEDITILKDETEIVNGELVFKEKELIAQFISYAVGCVFGRYSLDKEGLILANHGETFQDYLVKVGKTKEQLQFVPDEDNIVPLLEDEWFYDDIVTRVKDFVKAVWGAPSYNDNIAYIENALGKDLRKYLVKDFYKDHIKRYKKRPIYWQFSSPKGAFNVLIYMHRYSKDTLSEILNGYLREFIGKLENHIKHLETVVVTGSAAEQAKARKEIDKLKNQIDECRAYEVELYKLAAERIEIDLDEGVLVNYNKFGNVIAPVAGLNDKKTKDKVKKFDWIDTTQIR